MPKSASKSIFSLEITREGGKIKISAFTKSSDDEKTVRQYETKGISESEIGKICSAIVHLLNRANRQGELDKNTLEEVKTSGQLLYDSLLTAQVKKQLTATKCEHLIMIVDDQLVHIPWELLFDGDNFLCRRFNMGRIVRTSQKITDSAVRKIRTPIKMLLVADPRNDLKNAYKEGVSLRDELDKNVEIINVDLRSDSVDATSIKGALRYYDIFHYAGHADYNAMTPSESGFLMDNGKLTASDVINMIGPAPMPLLVFSNACKSGHTDKWRVGEDYESEIYGLANAFLLAGVQHYIGTFWDVQDEPGLYFAMDFYRELVKGAMVGEAVRKARSGLIERYGENAFKWASYMLYGDPTVRYVDSSTPGDSKARQGIIAENEDEKELVGSVRGAETEIVFPRKNQKLMLAVFIISILLASFIAFSVFRTESKFPVTTSYKVDRASAQDRETKNRRIDELVAALINDYEKNKKAGKRRSSVQDTSELPTLVFLNIKANGVVQSEKDYIFTRITNILQNSGAVQVVEREILDKLLEELKMSSSQLADPGRVLEVGKILSAQVISTGSIARDGREWQISLRMIDTETTSIRAALTSTVETGDKDKIAETLSKEILNKLMSLYPSGEKSSLSGKE